MKSSRKQTPKWRKGLYVRLCKIGQQAHGVPACPAAWYTPGASLENHLSTPIGIRLEGFLLASIREGGRIRLDRHVRDGVVARGIFCSSRVYSIRNNEIHTGNSVYVITRVPPLLPFEQEEKSGPRN